MLPVHFSVLSDVVPLHRRILLIVIAGTIISSLALQRNHVFTEIADHPLMIALPIYDP